ncbi:acylglycerol kinase family protein [Paraflavitalea speifideaquila]|uniref:diacylglycerol/lipid kinase family protein n=1 Tax=Paraflavitalea speifideaquila TaxID=3076558 RepID=UPI0028E8C26F|nr:acylglycerol kinase family protein [Paraflavitalea speifideiaquila]
MSRKIIYLINPISGTRGKDSLRDLIARRTTAAGIPFEIMDTDIAAKYYAVRKKIIAESVTDVVVCGGDGSVNQVVHALSDLDVQFGIIPMGSGNGLALAAGIPKASEKPWTLFLQEKPGSPMHSWSINNLPVCCAAWVLTPR